MQPRNGGAETMAQKLLTALPVYNEAEYVNSVLDQVVRFSPHTLVVDDGSTDATPELLKRRNDVFVQRHQQNRGYGAALRTAFQFAIQNHYDFLVTIDCDGQHEPIRIPRFARACRHADIVSGSRYLKRYASDSEPPAQRRWINHLITTELNQTLNLQLTDAFCGFKSYRVSCLKQLQLTENGYGMPLELWVEAAARRLRILELPVPLIYIDEKRSFGGSLDDGQTRLAYYRSVISHSLRSAEKRLGYRPSQLNPTERLGCR